jgi:hypothetical protein
MGAPFKPGLPRKVWLLQAGVLINFFGNGLVAPLLVIYAWQGGFFIGPTAGGAILGAFRPALPAACALGCLPAAAAAAAADRSFVGDRHVSPARASAS